MIVPGKREARERERERIEAVTHRRSPSASHSGREQRAVWSEALGGRPEPCVEKSCVKQLRVHRSGLCYTQAQSGRVGSTRAEDWRQKKLK